jgi:predicted amidohydrolase YtcJ
MRLVSRAHERSQQSRSPGERREDLLKAIRLASEQCLAYGVTSFQDAGSSFADVDLFRELVRQRALPVRLWVMLNESNDALAARLSDYRIVGEGQNHLTVRAIKRMFDGALGTHGAWLLEPYEDLPGSTGHNTTSRESLRRTAELALQHDVQLCVHAIGDRANREVLDLFEQDAGLGNQRRDLRWRIEHAQHLDPRDIPRFGHLGVIASMQGVHCTSDAPFVIQRLGQRRAAEGAYAWRRLLDAGAIVINGTDAPVESLDPVASLYASVTRKLPNGVPFFAEQRMSRQEALRSYTRDAAYAAFEETVKGTLSPGKLADLVVLSEDPLRATDEELHRMHVLVTVVGGRVVWERQ